MVQMSKWPFQPLEFVTKSNPEMLMASRAFYDEIRKRRTVRDFSDQSVDRGIIENAVCAAGTAPSGANMQPWYFVAVSDQDLKKKIRHAAEIEEKELYGHRASAEWLKALEPLGTNEDKPFLETAPWLIVVFLKKFTYDDQGKKLKNYYTSESVGIACGFLLTALHQAGLATLTHTPSPMKFLNDVLGRPADERAFMVIVAGHPASGAQVPVIGKKALEEISEFKE
jgi:nitroreductase